MMKLSLTLFLVIILTACNTQQNQADLNNEVITSEKEKINESFDFSYKDLDGNTIKLSDYRGKWVVVNFWATWCPPCRKEIPDFVKFKTMFADKVEVLGIDNEDAELEKIKDFVFEYEINYPILMMDVYNLTDFEKENGAGLPTTIIFNPQGEQVSKIVGPMHFKDLIDITGLTVLDDSMPEKDLN